MHNELFSKVHVKARYRYKKAANPKHFSVVVVVGCAAEVRMQGASSRPMTSPRGLLHSTPSSVFGSHRGRGLVRRPPTDDDILNRNPVFAQSNSIRGGMNEVIGFHTGVRSFRSPPVPPVFAMLANTAVREGRTSADFIGFSDNRAERLAPITIRATTSHGRGSVPTDPTKWSTSSTIIGVHPKPMAVRDKAARMHCAWAGSRC